LNPFLDEFLVEFLHCDEILEVRPERLVQSRATGKEEVNIKRVSCLEVTAVQKSLAFLVEQVVRVRCEDAFLRTLRNGVFYDLAL
jgi:hypothetical protein